LAPREVMGNVSAGGSREIFGDRERTGCRGAADAHGGRLRCHTAHHGHWPHAHLPSGLDPTRALPRGLAALGQHHARHPRCAAHLVARTKPIAPEAGALPGSIALGGFFVAAFTPPLWWHLQ